MTFKQAISGYYPAEEAERAEELVQAALLKRYADQCKLQLTEEVCRSMVEYLHEWVLVNYSKFNLDHWDVDVYLDTASKDAIFDFVPLSVC